MSSRRKLAALTAAVLVPVLLIALSMSLALAGEAEFDVEIMKWGENEYAIPGEDFTYTISVTNSADGADAFAVEVTDTLPPEVEYVVDPDGCTEDSPGVLSCDLGGLPAGEETSFDITVHIAPDAFEGQGTIWNTAEVSATTELGAQDSASVMAGVSLWEQADLTAWKEVFPGGVVPPGEWFTYTLWAENLGPSTSRYPIIMDWFATDGSLSMIADGEGICGPMPTDQGWAETPAWLMTWVNSICSLFDIPICGDPLEWVPVWWYYWHTNFPPTYPYPLAVDWMCVWPLRDVDPGLQISRTVSVLPLDAQTIYNQAWALPDLYPMDGIDGFDGFDEFEYYGTPDPNLLNNVDELVTQVTDEADLKVVKFSKPDDQVDAGLPFTYTIFVENLGPAHAQKVSIRDEMLSSGNFEIVNVLLDLNRENEGPIFLDSPEGGVTMEFHLHEPLEPKGPDNQGRWVIQVVLQAQETQDVNNLVQVFTREGGTFDPDLSNNEDEDSIAVSGLADLALEKSAAGPSLAGGPIQFQLDVHNNGPVAAQNVVLEDMLPQGLTVLNVDPDGGSCTTGIPGSEPLTCNLGTLDNGASATVIVVARIDPDYMGVLENDAVVSSDTYDHNNSNNRDYVIVRVETSANLTIDKVALPPSPWVAGEVHTYRYAINNLGPSVSRDVRLRDSLPAQVDFVSAYSVGGLPLTCNASSNNVLICPLGDIPPTDPPGVVVLVDVRIKPEVLNGTWIRNDANLISNTTDPFGASASARVMITNEADLSVWKEADPWKVYAGEQVMYTIRVTNHGPGNAYAVHLGDELPVGVLAELVTDHDACEIGGENGDYGELVHCAWRVFPAGETKTFYIFARVEPDAEPGTVSNHVGVESRITYDPVGNNDEASAPILIQGKADLKIQKFGKPEGEVHAGDELTYTVIVDNLGTGYAHDVTLDDVLESDGSFDLVEITTSLPALCDPETGTFDQDMFLTCALSDTLEVKGPKPGSGRWMLTVGVLANEPQDINNVAYVAGSDYDPDLSNNEAMAEHAITAVADLELIKEAWGEMLVGCAGETELWLDEVAAGNTVTYTLTVSNTGPSTAENVTVLDEPLPHPDLLEIDVESIEPSQGECLTARIVDERRLSCNLGTIGPEMTATVSFVAHVPSWVPDYTILVNDAQAYSDMFDNNNGNDVVTNHTIVSRVADLEVEKTQEPEAALPTQDITYTITITNLGPSDVDGIMISDTLPVQLLDATWTCCASEGECDVPCEPPTCPEEPCPWPDPDTGLFAEANIPVGERVIYTVEGVLDIWPCGVPFTNTVVITAPLSLVHPEMNIDPCTDNNTAEAGNPPPLCNYIPLALKEYGGPDSPL